MATTGQGGFCPRPISGTTDCAPHVVEAQTLFISEVIRGKWMTIPVGEAHFFPDFELCELPLVRPGQLLGNEGGGSAGKKPGKKPGAVAVVRGLRASRGAGRHSRIGRGRWCGNAARWCRRERTIWEGALQRERIRERQIRRVTRRPTVLDIPVPARRSSVTRWRLP